MWLSLVSLALAARPAPTPPDPAAVAAELLGRALSSPEPFAELTELCDQIGARLAGSPQLDRAILWAADEMRADGLAVTLQPVDVPVWRRGAASAVVLAPRPKQLQALLLGGSEGTKGPIEADVLVVSSFDELDRRAADAVGRVVVWDVPFTTYGETVPYRGRGAIAAAKHGAVASLVRSVTSESLYTPHTGAMRYDDQTPKIPGAAITVEDATWLHRLQSAGITPRIRLEFQAEKLPDVVSHNVIGEIVGRESPEEVVVLGCHLDSWDVGQGAQDDGAGCVAVMEAGRLLRALPTPPRRTVRVVLYTNEENGLRGGTAFADAYGPQVVAAVEMDTGAGAPLGFGVDVAEGDATLSVARLAPYAGWLGPLGASRVEPGHSGADIGPLVDRGALGLGLTQDTTGYWPIHHTEADTLDRVDPALLARNVAAMTVMGWILAEMPVSPRER
jgi:carboxypeptidase Q